MNLAINLRDLVRAHQVRGHAMANLDPLGIHPFREEVPELDPSYYGFTEKMLQSEADIKLLGAYFQPQKPRWIDPYPVSFELYPF